MSALVLQISAHEASNVMCCSSAWRPPAARQYPIVSRQMAWHAVQCAMHWFISALRCSAEWWVTAHAPAQGQAITLLRVVHGWRKEGMTVAVTPRQDKRSIVRWPRMSAGSQSPPDRFAPEGVEAIGR